MRFSMTFLCRLVLLCGSLTAADALPQDFPSLRWLHPGADPVQHLSSQYTECVDLSGPPGRHALVEAGRQFFLGPVIGGWAEPEGLSCESCHAGGRARAEFHLQGRSGTPGTVDIDLADGFDPRPIPEVLDLAPGPVLEERVAQHLVRDFGARPPARGLVEALAAYLGALSSSWCPAMDRVRLSVDIDLYEITRTINSVQYYFQVEDDDMARRMSEVLSWHLRALAARYGNLPALAAEIRAFEESLAESRETHFSGGAADQRLFLRRWHRRWLAFAPRLLATEGESLHDRARLEAWLRQR